MYPCQLRRWFVGILMISSSVCGAIIRRQDDSNSISILQTISQRSNPIMITIPPTHTPSRFIRKRQNSSGTTASTTSTTSRSSTSSSSQTTTTSTATGTSSSSTTTSASTGTTTTTTTTSSSAASSSSSSSTTSSSTTTSPSSTSSSASDSGGSSLSVGAIVGIVIGAVFGVAIISMLLSSARKKHHVEKKRPRGSMVFGGLAAKESATHVQPLMSQDQHFEEHHDFTPVAGSSTQGYTDNAPDREAQAPKETRDRVDELSLSEPSWLGHDSFPSPYDSVEQHELQEVSNPALYSGYAPLDVAQGSRVATAPGKP